MSARTLDATRSRNVVDGQSRRISFGPAGEWTKARSHIHFLVLLPPILFVAVYALVTLGRHSLWLDEAWVANKVIRGEIDPPGLNTTPVGFFLVLRLVTTLAGSSEFVLRLPAFFGLIATTLGTFFLARRLYGATPEAIMAAALVGTNFGLVTYAGNVKPYTIDSFVAVLILILALLIEERPSTRRWVAYGTVIAISPVFSFASVAVSASTAVFLLASTLRNPARRAMLQPWLKTHLVAATTVGLYGALVFRSQRSDDLVTYWSSGFPPDGGVFSTLVWSARQIWELLTWFTSPVNVWDGGERFVQVVFAILLTLGCVRFVRSSARYLMLLIIPFLLFLLSAIAHLYPFDPWLGGRLLLSILPAACILVAGGAGWAFSFGTTGKRARVASGVGLLLALMLAIHGAYPQLSDRQLPAAPHEELRDLVRVDLLPNVAEGDSIYVYYVSIHAFEYYAPSLRGVDMPLLTTTSAVRNGVNVVYGGTYDSEDGYANELATLLDRSGAARVWIVLTHIQHDREASMQDVMRQHGVVDGVWRQEGATLYSVRVPVQKPGSAR